LETLSSTLTRTPSTIGVAEGGGEYFDYITLDAAARRIYLSHGTEIKVLEADSVENRKIRVVARDGLEPPTPAFPNGF
jgi:hypothetical protein